MKNTPQDWKTRIAKLAADCQADLSDDSMSRINFESKEDWRQYLPVAVVGMWPLMSAQERMIAFVCASTSTTCAIG